MTLADYLLEHMTCLVNGVRQTDMGYVVKPNDHIEVFFETMMEENEH